MSNEGIWYSELDNTLTFDATYIMSIISGSDTLLINDLVLGDVWLASGQSNMR